MCRTCGRDASIRAGEWRSALMVLALAAALLVAGPDIASRMFHSTKGIGWETPAGSAAVIAAQHADEFFPGRMRGAIVIAVEAEPDTPSVLTEVVAGFSRTVNDAIATDGRVSSFKPVVLGYYLDAFGRQPPQKQLQGELVSADERMTVILIQPTRFEGQWSDVNALLQEFCGAPPAGYTLHITGMPAVHSGDGCSSGVHAKVNTVDMNFECVARAEMLSLPAALLIMAYIVKYPRLLLVSLLTVVVTFFLAAAMVLPWMDVFAIPQDAPAAMGSVIMAGCLDYSLFIMSRFSEEHRHLPLQQCVDKIKRYTCRTIFVSGSLVGIAFVGSILIPERNIQGTGVCLGLAAMAGVVTSIILTPAVLVVAGKFFTGFAFTPTNWGDVGLEGYVGDNDEPDESAQFSRPHRVDAEKSCWLGVMRMVDRSPLGALGLVLLLLGPVLVHLPELNITGDSMAVLPMTMPALTALRRVQDSFPVGILDPYAIVITSPLQGEGACLDEEIRRGAEDFKSHNLLAAASNLGLSQEEVSAATAAMEFLGGGGGAKLTQEKTRGVDDVGALKAAVRAAHEKAAAPSDVGRAVAAAATAVREKGAQLSHEVREAVQSEAPKLGMSAAEAAKIVTAAGGGSPTAVGSAVLAAAATGAAAGAAGLREGGLSTVAKAVDAGRRLAAPAEDVAKVLHAVEALPVDSGKRLLDEPLQDGAQQVLHAVEGALPVDSGKQILSQPLHDGAQQAVHQGEHTAQAALSDLDKGLSTAARQKLPLIQTLVHAVANMSIKEHGTVLLPSGFAAMLDLCEAVQNVGGVASMLGPTWAFHHRVDWAMAVALHANPTLRSMYHGLLETHVNGHRALLEVHTTFPSIGAGGSSFVRAVREAIAQWERAHPGYKAELAGGASEATDIRKSILDSMWSYLGVSVFLITGVVYGSFKSLLVPLRLAVALLFTLAATFGTGAVIYQTPILHGVFPNLKYFDGISYEVVPLVTGVCIALGLDYDIFLISRIVEFRLQRFSDRASIFRGVVKTGDVISAAGLIMSLAFTGLCFSDKLLFQQFGTLLIASVLFDTFVVRTVLVPALMLVAQGWNWWPRDMPPAIHDILEGEFESDGGLSRPILEGMSMGNVVPTADVKAAAREQWYMSGMIA